jgi:hypothetical protein
MNDFDYVFIVTALLETMDSQDDKLHFLVALECATSDKELYKAINELRWNVLHPEEATAKINGVEVHVHHGLSGDVWIQKEIIPAEDNDLDQNDREQMEEDYHLSARYL